MRDAVHEGRLPFRNTAHGSTYFMMMTHWRKGVGSEITIDELAGYIGLEYRSVVRLLTSMDEQGLIRRVTHRAPDGKKLPSTYLMAGVDYPAVPLPGCEVYVIEAGETGYFKIGLTRAGVSSRIKHLQTGNPQELFARRVITGGRDVEEQLHQAFSDYHVRDEWFTLPPDWPERLDRIVSEMDQGLVPDA